MTILIRDRAQEDKVVKVIEPLDTVDLTYGTVGSDEDKRLLFVHTDWPDYNGAEIKQIHKLFFGDYLTSEDETITTLHKVQQSTEIGRITNKDIKVVRTCKQCPVFSTLENEMDSVRNGRQEGGGN